MRSSRLTHQSLWKRNANPAIPGRVFFLPFMEVRFENLIFNLKFYDMKQSFLTMDTTIDISAAFYVVNVYEPLAAPPYSEYHNTIVFEMAGKNLKAAQMKKLTFSEFLQMAPAGFFLPVDSQRYVRSHLKQKNLHLHKVDHVTGKAGLPSGLTAGYDRFLEVYMPLPQNALNHIEEAFVALINDHSVNHVHGNCYNVILAGKLSQLDVLTAPKVNEVIKAFGPVYGSLATPVSSTEQKAA